MHKNCQFCTYSRNSDVIIGPLDTDVLQEEFSVLIIRLLRPRFMVVSISIRRRFCFQSSDPNFL